MYMAYAIARVISSQPLSLPLTKKKKKTKKFFTRYYNNTFIPRLPVSLFLAHSIFL